VVPTADPATVPGLPETGLHPADLASLPAATPPAPWVCQARALVWWQLARPPAHAWLRRPLPVAVGAFVHYLDSPVGSYHEVLAGAVLLAGGLPVAQIPFIAVDSLPSVHGGRVNWALPKTTAWFEGDPRTGSASARGRDWSVQIRTGRPGPAVPVRLRFGSLGPLGRYLTTVRAIGRPVIVRADTEGVSLGRWLGAGRHLGLLLEGRLQIDAPVPARPAPARPTSARPASPRRLDR